jgi:hypothetical protein
VIPANSTIEEQLKVIAVYAGCMSLYGEASAVTAAPEAAAFSEGPWEFIFPMGTQHSKTGTYGYIRG